MFSFFLTHLLSPLLCVLLFSFPITYTVQAKGSCNINSFNDPLPLGNQYFSSPKKGGGDSLADYCPYPTKIRFKLPFCSPSLLFFPPFFLERIPTSKNLYLTMLQDTYHLVQWDGVMTKQTTRFPPSWIVVKHFALSADALPAPLLRNFLLGVRGGLDVTRWSVLDHLTCGYAFFFSQQRLISQISFVLCFFLFLLYFPFF